MTVGAFGGHRPSRARHVDENSAAKADVARLQQAIEAAPETIIETRVDSGAITAGSLRINGAMPAALRDAFVSGQWNPTAMLLDKFEQVRAVASKLPYLSGF